MLVSSPRVVASLRGIARALSSNPADRDDLLQEMLIHLWQSETANPGQTESWYLQNCKFFGLDCLKRGRSVDSKQRAGCVLVSMDQQVSDTATPIEPADDRDFRDQLSAGDVLSLLRQRLTAGQQALLDAFAGGASVSEVSETLGCSHQYVSKQRKKIALALAGVLG